MFPGVGVTFRGRFPGEISNVIRPLFLRTDALFGERLDSVAKKCAAILISCSFNHAFVVINKKPAKIDKWHAVLQFEEFDGANERISRATTKLPLVFDGRAFRAKIDLLRQSRDPCGNRRIHEIAMVRQIR